MFIGMLEKKENTYFIASSNEFSEHLQHRFRLHIVPLAQLLGLCFAHLHAVQLIVSVVALYLTRRPSRQERPIRLEVPLVQRCEHRDRVYFLLAPTFQDSSHCVLRSG